MESMDCDRVRTEEIAERYLLGRLTEPDRDAFEAHFFECDACLDHLRTLEALQAELASTALLPERATAIRRAPMWVWAVAALVLAATTAGLWFAISPGTRAPAPRVTQERAAPAPETSSPRPEPNAAVLELARVEPPPYFPVTLRGARDRAAETFDAAMTQYAEGDFAAAASGLEKAVTLDVAAARAHFYLGIARLMTGQTDAAIAALEQCLRTGDEAYAEAARFFLAKALMRSGALQRAQRELAIVANAGGARSSEAGRLLAALQTLQ